ncbi:hypothetical protein TW85_16380 [Marinomonas sp. S3726]|uniref:hypothetical protein n=1 Tax=Marinomonas sp. S3726 TaxID=579484 RepID=UPI0005FA6E53|nr:hypothetical protein [Marinomonas sp. S3726]KJZ11951.1 hypothetical protein TW85_16380 [Marinomonas sp. S3726]
MDLKNSSESLGNQISNYLSNIIDTRKYDASNNLISSIEELIEYCTDTRFTVSSYARYKQAPFLIRLKNIIVSSLESTIRAYEEVIAYPEFEINSLENKEEKEKINLSGIGDALSFFREESNWSSEFWVSGDSPLGKEKINEHTNNIEKVRKTVQHIFGDMGSEEIKKTDSNLNIIYIVLTDLHKKLYNQGNKICPYCFRHNKGNIVCHLHRADKTDKDKKYLEARKVFDNLSDEALKQYKDFISFRKYNSENDIVLSSQSYPNFEINKDSFHITIDSSFHKVILDAEGPVWNDILKSKLDNNIKIYFPPIYNTVKDHIYSSESLTDFIDKCYMKGCLDNQYERSRHPFFFFSILSIASDLILSKRQLDSKFIERDERYFEKKKTMTYKQIVDSEIKEGHMILKEGESRKGKESNIKKIIKRMSE